MLRRSEERDGREGWERGMGERDGSGGSRDSESILPFTSRSRGHSRTCAHDAERIDGVFKEGCIDGCL
jgi:hypothetical protein